MRLTQRLARMRLTGSAVKSVQQGSINLANVTSNTATIVAVNPAHSILYYLGRSPGDTGNAEPRYHNARVVFTNGTTITAVRGDSDGTGVLVRFMVVEYWPGVIKSIQRGSRTGNGTVTIAAVNLKRAHIVPLGISSVDNTTLSLEMTMELTDATTVTTFSGANQATGFQVVEWW